MLFRSYVEEAVTSYNTEHGGAAAFENEKDQEKLPTALKSCSLEGQTGKLGFEYRLLYCDCLDLT